MQAVVQNVINFFFEVTPNLQKKLGIHISLILATKERKTYGSMARAHDLPYEYVFIKKNEAQAGMLECGKFLISQIKKIAEKDGNLGSLIIDFTLIQKAFAEHIPNVTYDHDGVSKRVSKGISAGFCFWSNGKVTVPFNFSTWLRKKDAGELYKKKIELAIELVQEAKKMRIPFSHVLLDGAFASRVMLSFLTHENIDFTMRIPSNRIIINETASAQLSSHPDLQLKRNHKYKTIQATYKEIPAYFTAHKRRGNKGKREVVFIISSVKRTAKEHVDAYAKRWPCEKVIRTAKQHLGLSHCQSTDADKQRFHIFSVMTTYAILEIARYDKKKCSVELLIHQIRLKKSPSLFLANIDKELTFMC